MNRMSSRPRTRFTAAVMLFVWLLTLGAGIANACVLHEDHAQAGQAGIAAVPGARESGAGDHRRDPAQVVAAAVAADGDQWVHSATCRALCVAGQTAMPKQKAAACADQQTDPVPVSVCGPVDVLAGPVLERMRLADAPRPEPPVFIRFLRLSL